MKTVFISAGLMFCGAQAFADVGLETAFGLNRVQFQRTVYVGQCPGEELTPVETFFVSSKTPGGEGRSVIVRNISPAMTSDVLPFIDKKYEGARSEHAFLNLDTEHRSRMLSVVDGLNEFQFSIFSGADLIDSGEFLFTTEVVEKQVVRSMECRWEFDCSGGFPSGGGPACRQVWRCACPF